MKKKDFINVIKEVGDISDIIKTLSDQEALDTTKETLTNLDNIQKKMDDIGLTNEEDDVQENVQENFVDSKIFTIIAESETPKISKKEIVDIINRNHERN